MFRDDLAELVLLAIVGVAVGVAVLLAFRSCLLGV